MPLVRADYQEFLKSKSQFSGDSGFEPVWMPDFLFDFQKALVEWAVRKGRCAIFADCGLGKTPMQLVWAENVVRKTNGRVLILTPLAVSAQTIREGEKFGIECQRSRDGQPHGKMTVTNYEQLHQFRSDDYIGVVCDESSILKNFDGKRKAMITEFLRTRPYRLCCTATAAPNDYIELGTTSEALGELGFMDMLGRFFKNDQNTSDVSRKWIGHGGDVPKWRFKRHAEKAFWQWVCSWARALRRPSDLGYDDGAFILPPLNERETLIDNIEPFPAELFQRTALSLAEQRFERRRTMRQCCEDVAAKLSGNSIAVAWCHLNPEGDLLERLIPDAMQVSGADSDDRKEEILTDFSEGKVRVLITKPRIGGFGLNWQHCAHMTFFPSHSFEQYYQATRRCWRFGQTRPVVVDIITTPGEIEVLHNLQRKAKAAETMFSALVSFMNNAKNIVQIEANLKEVLPLWL